ncbi:hypothetical protein PHYSODRAFT_532479, partial [Phytophthora sojae]
MWDRELGTWYEHQQKSEPSSIYARGATWIERRQLLRSSLTPLGNAQIDALHTILVVIMKRIVTVLREIRQFEQFEMLSTDEMRRKCRLIHTVNADPNSEYIGRTLEKLSLDVRREIVVGLENELLDLAGVKDKPDDPKPGTPREEWMQIRSKRQQLLRDHGDFFMSDQTSTSILSVPKSFTGKGIIAWILREPTVLWSDEWRNALCAAGFVENVTPGIVALADLGKRQVLMENKADRFYRLHEVDMWIEKLPREKSLFPLDLTEETSQVVEKLLWNWKYCLFIPGRRQLYLYEQETSTYPMAFIDMASAACKVAYHVTSDAKGGWLDIKNPTVYKRKPDSQDYVPATTEALDEMARVREKGERVIEFKTQNTQKWIRALARAGVCVEAFPGQRVLMKRLNPVVLQQKCNKHATRFKPNDLDGSFHRLLNRLFGHDRELSYEDHERERREQRAQLRSELKKAGAEGDVVMAYYGKGKQLKSKPKYSGNYKNGSLYSARILRIRTPFTEEHYPIKTKYDLKDKEMVPHDLTKLLAKYKVSDQASWMTLPMSQRDMFLLYDVEYSHANERIVEVGLMREHVRMNEGDLDPQKVSDKCTDLNIMFKATDLENCVSRMLKHRYRHKPLGILKIPVTMISPHRTIDAWYPLGPANDMLQKTGLGQIRVELKRKQAPFAEGHEPSFVKVSILEGRSLQVADLFTSDPFVEIVLLGEEDSKEHDTGLKTDIKMRTLNPTWENQEFLLGKTEKTKLSGKKGIMLRVMDYDATSANDPLGRVILEFQRSEAGYIRGVTMKHSDTMGENVTEELKLDKGNRVVVEAKLLPCSAPEFSKRQKKKAPKPDGLLGKLRFVYTCYFQPHGEGGLRIQYAPASEDLGEAYKILGRTYDLAKVDYLTVRLVSDSTGRVLEGQLGKLDKKSERKSDDKEEKPKLSLRNPLQRASFRDETIVLIDQENPKQKVTLTFDLNLIGILRADRVRRILADTFRMAGLSFDSRTFNSGRYNPDEVLTQELLTQVRVMSQATKLHWKVTPQLLAYVFEIVFSAGERDRLSYADAVALDDVLNRWSRILSHVNEAKDYMTGNLHGMKTPRLLEALFMECEVTAQVPLLKCAGVLVDVRLSNDEIVAAMIVKEYGDDRYDVKLVFVADAAFLGATFSSSLHCTNPLAPMDTGNDLWWGSEKALAVYAILPAPVKSIQARHPTTNSLIQGFLTEKNEKQSGFLGQYHGFVKGESLDKNEVERLETVYTAACKR